MPRWITFNFTPAEMAAIAAAIERGEITDMSKSKNEHWETMMDNSAAAVYEREADEALHEQHSNYRPDIWNKDCDELIHSIGVLSGKLQAATAELEALTNNLKS